MVIRMPNLDARLGAALADLCEEAADLVRPLWNSGLAVDRKSDDSPVTEADRRAEALILAGPSRLSPEAPVVSEEHASESGPPGKIRRTLLPVDPAASQTGCGGGVWLPLGRGPRSRPHPARPGGWLFSLLAFVGFAYGAAGGA